MFSISANVIFYLTVELNIDIPKLYPEFAFQFFFISFPIFFFFLLCTDKPQLKANGGQNAIEK